MNHYGVKVKLFADDVKLYVKVINDVAVDDLQRALAALVQWAEDWQLALSVDKCCMLCIGKDVVNRFSICDVPLPVVTFTRDLGVTVSQNLSFSQRITGIVIKAHQRANMIHRCFVSGEPWRRLVNAIDLRSPISRKKSIKPPEDPCCHGNQPFLFKDKR